MQPFVPAFWPGPKTILFDDARQMLPVVLKNFRKDHCAVGVASASGFRLHFGGMGSLKDLVICRENH